MSMSPDRSVPGPRPSPVRAGALTLASWAVWALWLICAVFVTAMVLDTVVDLAGELF